MAARRAAAVIRAAPSAILDFERFAGGLSFLSSVERCRLLVAGGEIFDNIVKHSSPLWGNCIAVKVRRLAEASGGIVLTFRFRGAGFAAFASGSSDADPGQPRFDPEHRRWRGLGLAMCRNIARRVSLKPGLVADRIVVEFDSSRPD